LLQKAGLRDLERQATFAIESGRTNYSIAHRTPGDIAEGVFRKVAFDWTTRYGLEPARALFSIALIWALLIPVYSWPIWRYAKHSKRASGIYRVLPKDRIELHDGTPSLDNPARVGVFTHVAWQPWVGLHIFPCFPPSRSDFGSSASALGLRARSHAILRLKQPVGFGRSRGCSRLEGY
jgi:hypothetical protein